MNEDDLLPSISPLGSPLVSPVISPISSRTSSTSSSLSDLNIGMARTRSHSLEEGHKPMRGFSGKKYQLNAPLVNQNDVNFVANSVLGARTYSELPDRILVSSEFRSETFVSYGIIAFCPTTQRWLMVRERYSFHFILFVRGSYRKSSLPEMFQNMSQSEIDMIYKCLESESEFKTIFYKSIMGKKRDHNYAYQYMMKHKNLIVELLANNKCFEDNHWYWPKGSKENQMETSYKCAIREFREETGLHITSEQHQVCSQTINDSFKAKHGQIYESKLWVFVFPKELDLPEITDLNSPGEIGDRRWVSTPEAIKLLRDDTTTLVAALSILEKTPYKPILPKIDPPDSTSDHKPRYFPLLRSSTPDDTTF